MSVFFHNKRVRRIHSSPENLSLLGIFAVGSLLCFTLELIEHVKLIL